MLKIKKFYRLYNNNNKLITESVFLQKKAYSESETLRLPHIPLNLFQCGELRFPIKQ
jgi:hypothetical protein